MAEPVDFTELLHRWSSGDEQAREEVIRLVYKELRGLAAAYLQGEDAGHTLQPTALVHEAYIRLLKQPDREWKGRGQFFGVIARVMRQVLVDHARRKRAAKRGYGRKQELNETMMVGEGRSVDVIALDDVLSQLQAIDNRKCELIELRFFGGLTLEEAAEAMDISVQTARRELRMAETWLFHELTSKQP